MLFSGSHPADIAVDCTQPGGLRRAAHKSAAVCVKRWLRV